MNFSLKIFPLYLENITATTTKTHICELMYDFQTVKKPTKIDEKTKKKANDRFSCYQGNYSRKIFILNVSALFKRL